MWRLKKSLMDSVVFLKKKISFCKVSFREQNGEKFSDIEILTTALSGLGAV